ncbi:hypothetical protein [Aurantiacibacter zhengii]|nr:hypothetical protein [Aurantiacibacter zhengii]
MSFGMVLGAWIVLRIALWESPLAPATGPILPDMLAQEMADQTQIPPVRQSDRSAPAQIILPLSKDRAAPADLLRSPAPEPLRRPDFGLPEEQDRDARRMVPGRAGMRGADLMNAHTMLLAAGYRSGVQTGQALPYRRGAGPIAPGAVYAPSSTREFADADVDSGRRWSMDLWALWRDDTTTPITSGRPSYGRSQVGAVVRYRIDRGSGHAPRLYMRATRALDGASETDVALGASARPLASVPVRLAAEARLSETDAGTELRGAAFAVSELAPFALPAGFTAEAYVQGGYVTGEFATPFVDGQARVSRKLFGTDKFRLTAGGGVWGGAQDDAQRLDVGPSAGVSFRMGQARGRLSADYRFRVAGDAEPASGPALTLTAGF